MSKIPQLLRIRTQLLVVLLFVASVAGAAWYTRERVNPVSTQAFTCDFYTSPTGASTNNGTIGSPWDLQTALYQPSGVVSGKTICMLGGTYQGKFFSSLSGATLRSAPGQWAKVDGYYTTTTAAAIPQVSAGTRSDIQINGNFQMVSAMTIFVDNELMQIDSNLGNGVYRVNRGWGGTAIVAHNAGAPVHLTGSTIELNGNNTTYRDFEVMNSNPNRAFNNGPGYGGADRGEGDGFIVFGDNLKIINTVIHDNTDGILVSEAADSFEIYGSIIYNNGHVSTDRGHGHGMYIQNNSADDFFREVISFNNFSSGMKAYGANQGHSNNVHFEGIISFNNGSPSQYVGTPNQNSEPNRRQSNIFIGSDVYPSTNVSVKNSYIYHAPGMITEIGGMAFGRAPSGGNDGAVVSNNFLVDPHNGFSINQWSNFTLTGNTQYLSGKPNNADVNETLVIANGNLGTFTINNNNYFDSSNLSTNCNPAGSRHPFYATGVTYTCSNGTPIGALPFDTWKQGTGFDANSSYSGNRPTGKNIFVRPNAYEPGRANIAVYNWDLSSTVTVNLDNAGLTPGQQFEIRSAENYMGAPVLANQTYSAGMSVTLPSGSRTVATPIGHSYTPASTCPEFCAYVVVPISTGSTPTPTPPTISSFTASPSTITSGQSTTLSWTVSGAATLAIDQNVGTVTGNSTSVSPTATTTYTLTATNSDGSVTRTATVTVNTTPPPQVGDCTGVSNCISLNSGTTYQTMDGWEATTQAGEFDATTFNAYKNALFDDAVNNLGINRVRLEIRAGSENTVDHWSRYRSGQIDYPTWRSVRYEIVNDDNDPNSMTASNFHWAEFDHKIDNIVLPLKQRLQARGEQLYINVNYVDFGPSTFEHKNSPAEYAEFVLATYQHLQTKYNIVPDSWEIILEPDTTGASWSSSQVANAIKAAGDRLVAAGYASPKFVAPSVTNGANTSSYVSAISSVSGAMQYIDTFSYHRYCCVDQAMATTIANLGSQHNKKTAMLEWIGADYNTLHQDLKFGNKSSWQQFTLAYPGSDDGGAYYVVNDSNGTFTLGSRTKFLRQYFKHVRKGAVRYSATSNGASFDPLAFRNTDNKHAVIVKATAGGTFSIAGLPAGTYGIFYTTASAYDQQLANQTIGSGERLSTSIPAAGVITIYATAGGGTVPPVISSFSASPGSITSGQSSTLSWSVSGATSLSINQGIGTVTGTSRSVSPTTTTTYTLTATNSGGATTSTATVTVTQPGDTTLPTVSITAPTAGSTVSGSAVTLSANANDNIGVVGVQFKVDGVNVGAEDTAAPYSVTWNSTLASNGSHSITAVARDAAGNSATSAIVTVNVNNAVVTVPTINSFTATPSTITAGQSSTLAWNVTGATSLSINQGIGTVTGTSITVGPSSTITYTLSATNSAGVTTRTVTVTVNPAPPTGDTTAPVISNIAANQTSNDIKKARISWTTDEASTTQVEWGSTTSYGNTSTLNTAMVTSHIMNITVAPGTLYHYRVKSRDAAGNLATSTDQTFTSQVRPPKPPRPNSLTFSTGSIKLIWGSYDYDACAMIEIHRSTTAAPQTATTQTLLASVECSATQYTDSAVTPGTTYHYSLFIKDDIGNFSDPLSGSFVAPSTSGGSSGGGGGGGGRNNIPSTPSSTPGTPSGVILPVNVIAGQVIKFPDKPTIYLVQSTGLHPFDTWSSFQDYQAKSGAQIITRSGTATTYTVSSILAKTILGQSATTAPSTTPPSTSQPTDKSNFVCSGSKTVYYYNNGKKEAYSESAVYEAWNGKSYSNIISVESGVCATIPDGGLVRLPEGTIVRVPGGPEIYMISGNSARPFTSYAAYQRDSAGKTVFTISLSYLHTYSRGENIY